MNQITSQKKQLLDQQDNRRSLLERQLISAVLPNAGQFLIMRTQTRVQNTWKDEL